MLQARELTSLEIVMQKQIENLTDKIGKQMQWVPVSERLPELGEEVIVFVPDGRVKITALCRRLRYEGAKDFFWENSRGTGNYHLPESVTHWMPLPPAPEGE